jgi:hypothetical protein
MKGSVYILFNPSMPGLLKIGKSKEGGAFRADNLYTTGVPEPFQVLKEAFVSDMDVVEKNIHDLLKQYRPNPSREFFRLEYEDCFNKIKETFPEIEWIEPQVLVQTKKERDTWDKYKEELSEQKQRADSFETYAEKYKWFDHKDCFEGSIVTRRNFDLYIKEKLRILQEGFEGRPDALLEKSQYLKTDDKYAKKEFTILKETLDVYEEKYKNWPTYNGPCLCNQCK